MLPVARALPPVGDPLLQRDQGPFRVDGGAVGGRLAVDVVEHLQRQRPPVARVEHRPGERGEVEGALPGEQPVVPAPLEHVHAQVRGVGELEEEQFVRADGVQAGQVVAPGEHVEAVQAQPEGGVVGAPDDLGRVPPGVDVPTPGQRLVGDAEAACGGPLGQGVQVFGGEVVVVDGVGRDRRAHEHGVRTEPLHQVELVLGAAQIGGQQRPGHRLEVPERLEEVHRQAQPGAVPSHRLGGQGRGDQVVLEDLHTVEARPGRGVELVLQSAGQAHRGDAAAHGLSLCCSPEPDPVPGGRAARPVGRGVATPTLA